MSILIKPGVVFKEINIFILKIFHCLIDLGMQLGKNMVITSANDGKHKEGSLHYKNLALDIRTRHLEKDEIQIVLNYLRNKLGGDYDVILESDHIHIEYDPKYYTGMGSGK